MCIFALCKILLYSYEIIIKLIYSNSIPTKYISIHNYFNFHQTNLINLKFLLNNIKYLFHEIK